MEKDSYIKFGFKQLIYEEIKISSSGLDTISIEGFNKAINDYNNNTTATPPPLEIPTFNSSIFLRNGSPHLKNELIAKFQISTILKAFKEKKNFR